MSPKRRTFLSLVFACICKSPLVNIWCNLQWEKLLDFNAFPVTLHWCEDTNFFPACWILIDQFKFPARQPYARIFGSWLQRLRECVRRHFNFYTADTLKDFPSWLSTSKNQPFFISNRDYTERYFSDKVHVILIEEVPLQTMLRDGASFRRN